MSLSQIKCIFFGHKIKKFKDPNYTPPKRVNHIHLPTLTFNNHPHWMMEYSTNWGATYIVHPCDRCGVMIAAKKVERK